MNPCFRYVKLRYLDIRKLSYSIVTSLKEPEHVTKTHDNFGSECWLNIDVSGRTRPSPSPEQLYQQDRSHRKPCRLEQKKSIDLQPHQQKLDLECLVDKQWGLASSVIKRHNNVNKNTNAVYGTNISTEDFDSHQLQFSEGSSLSQQKNPSPRENELSNRNYQSRGDDKQRSDKSDKEDRPSHAQLQKVANYYEDQILAMHAKSEDFSQGLHSRNIIFENNYTRYPASCQGIDNYRMALAKMRILGNLSYVTYRFQLVGLRLDMDEGAVILHWRLYYINNLRFFTHTAPRVIIDRGFKNAYDEDEAISTFFVNSEGQIVKHKVEKTIPLKGEKKKAVGILDRLRKKMNLAVT